MAARQLFVCASNDGIHIFCSDGRPTLVEGHYFEDYVSFVTFYLCDIDNSYLFTAAMNKKSDLF